MTSVGQDRVTVVVMTRNRWSDLRSTLPRHEAPVIVVDNGSTDGTPALVRAHFPHVDVVELGSNHGAVARNVGVERARTPYVAFADDDSWWAPGALPTAAGLLDSHPRLGLVAGRMLVGLDHEVDPVVPLMAAAPLGQAEDLPGPSVLGFLACGAVVRREAFLAAGGFDDLIFFMGEEERLALDLAALGWGLSYSDQVVAHHHPSTSRDTVARRARADRNKLLTTVLRRPWPVVLGTVLEAARDGRAGRLAIREALVAMPKALARRRLLPAHVEAARRMLEDPSRLRSGGGPGARPSRPSSRPAVRVRSRSRSRSRHADGRRHPVLHRRRR
jgi:GT2 family glycosyltransferase